LTLLAYPAEGGTVSGGGDYIAGSQVTVSASPNPGFEFLNWRKDGVIIESAPEFQYTMPPYHHTLVAHFIPEGTPTYDVTLAVNNPDYGYVTGEGTFVEGDYVIVQAFQFAGYIFDHWSDDNDLYEQSNPYVFAMPDDDIHLTANFRDVVNATIDPDTWEFDDFEDVPDEIVTTITWNDATDVTRVFVVFDDGMEADFSYRIEDNDGTTATLIMMPPAKSLNQKSYNLAGFVEFDLGAAAPLLFVFEDPSWFFHIRIRDEMYNIGIPNAEITIPELDMEFATNLDGWVNLNLPAGSYTLNVEAYGFESVQDVEFDVLDGIMGQELELEMTRKDDMWLQIISSEPVQNATHVPVTASIRITFDRPIQEGYFNNGFQNIFMNDEYGHYFGFQDIYIVEDNVLQFELHEPLQYGTSYWLTIPFYTVADAQSHVIFMEQHFILEFTTVLDSFNDASLSDLTIDGETLEGFSPGVFEYHVELPYNTVDPPVVDATANNPAADVDVVQAAVVTGTATVTVTAEDEVTQLVYTVAFTVAPNDDATLSDLSVNGTTVNGFDPDVLGYMVELPYGTTELPVVDAVATDPNAHVDIVQAAVVTGTATVTVTAEDEVTQLVYTVTFTVAPNDDATLADLSVDGTTLEGFDPDVLSYEVELPYGTTDVPVVSATAADVNASVEITQAAELPGTASVLVTAEDGVTVLTYTVAFSVAPNDDATLADLSVDGITLEGFDPDVLSYHVVLPPGTTDIPVVDATAADPNAVTQITQAEALPGTATVLVTAEDGVTQLTYTVEFTVSDTSVEEVLNNIGLYPNPATEVLTVEAQAVMNRILMYDMVGNVVLDVPANAMTYEVSVRDLKPGMYFIRIVLDAGTATHKIQVRR
ncbi:MAG: T9SS type A sorting domain-containing protein, partial [Bacteroidales bacterium]|nr:T9SS type A sorting domain-containing protein [Bacteroidales bacterium]